MKTETRCNKSASIGKTRWIAYAAAGAATALSGGDSAEAAIHYSGPVNTVFRGDDTDFSSISLVSNYGIEFVHFAGFAGFAVYSRSLTSKGVRGVRNSRGTSVSKLGFGENISAGPFVHSETSYFAKLASGSLGQWRDKGVGFIGFKFKGSGGVPRYGWARVKMAGQDRDFAFKLLDYAWADAGESIFAGQRSSDEKAPDQAVEQNSLGWLALGAVGLLAWRKRRSQAAR